VERALDEQNNVINDQSHTTIEAPNENPKSDNGPDMASEKVECRADIPIIMTKESVHVDNDVDSISPAASQMCKICLEEPSSALDGKFEYSVC
jgi:hypothetical protein